MALAVVASLLGADAASITNCGGPSDILQLSELSISPDPIERNRPFTFSAIGNFGQNFGGGSISSDVNATVELLGIHRTISKQSTTQFEFQPVVPSGLMKLVVGPTELPSLPGKVDIEGKVTIADGSGASVACIALSVHTPLAAQEEAAPLIEAPQGATSCAKPGDLVHDVSVNTTGDWAQATATLDKTLTEMNIHSAFKIHVGIIPKSITMNVPVLFQPGIPKGVLQAKVKQTAEATKQTSKTAVLTLAGPDPHVVGDVIVSDGDGQEITCIHVDNQDPSGAVREEVVVV